MFLTSAGHAIWNFAGFAVYWQMRSKVVCSWFSSQNGGSEVSISYSTTPSAQKSAALLCPRFWMISWTPGTQSQHTGSQKRIGLHVDLGSQGTPARCSPGSRKE